MCEAIKNFQTLDSNSKNLTNYTKGEPAVCFEKMHVYVYKVSYCEKGEMKDGKKFWGGIVVWNQLP